MNPYIKLHTLYYMKERALIKEILTFLELEDEDAFVFPFHDTLFSVTVDTLVAKTDVPEGMTPFQIGWKTAVMNLSDLAAMGASPQYFLCSLTVPGGYPALDIIRGVKAACDTYHCQYAGGDINEGDVSASGCAIGTSKTVMRRSGAQPGDHVGLTGDVGRVYAGLKDLVHATPPMRDKIFSPAPRLEDGLTLKAHSCIDISDGLSSELHHIAEASNVRIDICSDKIPIHKDVVKKAHAESESDVMWALKSGEEYELLFTDTHINDRFTNIGEIKKGKGVYLDGEPMPLLGWEHNL
jgi:thiamine-monophosphate kinase